jgi:hypothetical protein
LVSVVTAGGAIAPTQRARSGVAEAEITEQLRRVLDAEFPELRRS